MVKPPENLETFASFVKIVEALRGPDGCPWDKEQTHRSLVPYAIEETYELADAIESGDDKETIGELGDVLLQVVLHAEIARQDGRYSIEDVIRGISEKMVRRHTHVFGDVKVGSSTDVLKNWAEIKAKEKAGKPKPKNFELPTALPALQRAHKIGDKTQKAGFDWPDARGVLEKVDEEIRELKVELSKAPMSQSKLEHELGDVLFSVAQLARHLNLDAEQALRTTNARFEKRYFHMRNHVDKSGREWANLSDFDKEAAWQATKAELADTESSQITKSGDPRT